MTQFNVGINRPFKTGSNLSTNGQYTIVKLDTANQNQVLTSTTATDPIAGVVTGFAKDGSVGDTVTVQSKGFSVPVLMSASCNIGDLITATTGGQGVATTTAGAFVVGRALQAAAAQYDVIEVELLMCYNYHT